MRRALILLAVLAAACRDGVAPYEPADPFVADTSGRLTFNPRWDHAPVWTHNADSVYYTAQSYPSFPLTNGILIGVPRSGGTARLVMPEVQLGLRVQPILAGPAFSATFHRVAFFEVTEILDTEFQTIRCPRMEGSWDTIGSAATLAAAVLRVRDPNSTSSDIARTTVRFAGRTFNAALQRHIVVAHPFHRLFEAEGVPIFRPAFSPDGNRIVFSDGSRLLLWTIGQSAPVPLAGTDDGIMPAWSPDGQWIAFSRPFRGTPQRFFCAGWFSPNPGLAELPNIVHDRTVYPRTRENAQLLLIRPDGTGLRALGEGDAPAWLPDSRSIIAHRDEHLYRISLDTGGATLIPDTRDAFEPALSSNGQFIAYAKRIEIGETRFLDGVLSRGNYDIWATRFQQ